jgi:hypothetical protein
MIFQTFSEAHPNFSTFMVVGGFQYEGEKVYSTRLFDSKTMAVVYAQKLLQDDGFDYAIMTIIGNEGAIWKMPGATKVYTLQDGELTAREQEILS